MRLLSLPRIGVTATTSRYTPCGALSWLLLTTTPYSGYMESISGIRMGYESLAEGHGITKRKILQFYHKLVANLITEEKGLD